jgi:hypothetical protein
MSRVTKASRLTSVCSCNCSSKSFSRLKNLDTSDMGGSLELRFLGVIKALPRLEGFRDNDYSLLKYWQLPKRLET